MELFFVLKIMKIDPFMIKKTKPRFFEFQGFGHTSTSNNSVDQCCIFLKSSFWSASFDISVSPIKHFWFIFFRFFSSKNGWPDIIIFPKDSKKGKNIWNRFARSTRKGGKVHRVYTELRPCIIKMIKGSHKKKLFS